MSFASEIKQEVSQKIMSGSDERAELSALIQICSSLSFSSRGMALVVTLENAAVARKIYSLVRDRYHADIELYVKRKMNLKKNLIYGMRISYQSTEILKDLGIYSARGLREVPLQKIVQTDNNAKAYLAGMFLASGSINPPEKTSYHLELIAANPAHGEFLKEQMARFNIKARTIERRSKTVVYVKAAEKIADFLRVIEADQALMEFENVRISRDFTNSFTRLNNVDVANEVKAQAAARKQLEDIEILQKADRVRKLDDKLQDVVALRLEYPEASLVELSEIYERRTGIYVSKSGMKHRFVRIHELAEKAGKEEGL